jgi:GTP-binding protein HflX
LALIERDRRERIVLVGVAIPPTTQEAAESSLDELAALVDTAGADEADRVLQRRDSADPATFVGQGKAEELRDISETVDADTVVFDDELSPAQSRNLEKILGRTAIDRTAVILDIFAQHAHSQEGKAQVELAQIRYRLPRLRGRGKALSQQAGGIGTRGPGETQLEVDRRRLLRRMAKLEADLRDLTRNRRTQRKSRARSRLRTLAVVGYTNAGKSTLLNRLTHADVLVEDRLLDRKSVV